MEILGNGVEIVEHMYKQNNLYIRAIADMNDERATLEISSLLNYHFFLIKVRMHIMNTNIDW